jgi:uncharacterized membrane protein YjjP (DUF1212 family)
VIQPSGPPTDEIPIWTAPDGVETKTAQAVIDLAMRAGVAMLATGAAAADVTATVLMLTHAYGLRSVHVDVTYTSVAVSYHRGPDADPVTVMRVVRYRMQDYTRLERLRALIVDLTQDPVDVGEARVRFDSLIRAPHPYRRWLVTAAGASLAAAVAVLSGAGPVITVITFLTAALVSRVLGALARLGVASFFAQVLGSAIPTAVATLVVVGQSAELGFLADLSPSLIVASGIVLLLSGLSIVGAAEDALEGYYVTAGARTFEVVTLSLGIAVGVTIVLSVGQRLGYPIAISGSTILSDDVVVQVLCAAVISAAFAVVSYASGRVVAVAALAGALGWGILAIVERAGNGPTTASAAAALVVGFTAKLVARRLRFSALAVTTAAIVPLLPGRMAYEGISLIVSQPAGLGMSAGLPTLAGAFGLGLGLAAGVSLGTYLAGIILARRGGTSPQRAAGATVPGHAGRLDRPVPRPHVLSDTGELKAVGRGPEG